MTLFCVYKRKWGMQLKFHEINNFAFFYKASSLIFYSLGCWRTGLYLMRGVSSKENDEEVDPAHLGTQCVYFLRFSWRFLYVCTIIEKLRLLKIHVLRKILKKQWKPFLFNFESKFGNVFGYWIKTVQISDTWKDS